MLEVQNFARARACLECQRDFVPPFPSSVLCSAECRATRRARSSREREASRVHSPDAILRARLRNREWAAEHRACKSSHTWLAGAPPFHTHLPGGGMTISFSPQPHKPIELRHTRALHGALTAIQDTPHTRWPQWSLIPWGGGWAAYWFTDAGAALALTTRQAQIFDRPTAFRFGPLVRFRTPTVARRGRQRVRLTAITPVVIANSGRTNPVTCPTADNVASVIGNEFVNRLSPSAAWSTWARERICVNLVSRETQPSHVPMCGKFGTAHGWTGDIVLEVNATARWLLSVAERTGFGSRTAFGFGRIRLTEEP